MSLLEPFDLKIGDFFEGTTREYAIIFDIHQKHEGVHKSEFIRNLHIFGGVVFKGDKIEYTRYSSEKIRKVTFEQFLSGVTELKKKGLLKNFIK
jgi:hypothetical protein